mgnify:CR=1 FL=1
MKWTRRDDGYYVRWIDGVLVYRHRWMWEQAHGPIPAGLTVDHDNGVRGDDRLGNFNLVTSEVNCRLGSYALKPTNTSGYNCVSKNRIGKWVGSFRHNKCRVHCGSHDTPEQANEAVLAKRKALNAPTRRVA